VLPTAPGLGRPFALKVSGQILFAPTRILSRQAKSGGCLGIMMITFLCPNMGVSVESWFADTEDTDEIYERVTCLACRQLHMLNLRTGKILGVRQSPIGGSDVAATDESTLS
jgi:hypothetical protein